MPAGLDYGQRHIISLKVTLVFFLNDFDTAAILCKVVHFNKMEFISDNRKP